MKRYLLADFERLSKRIPRWILIGGMLAILVIINIITFGTSKVPTMCDDYVATVKSIFSIFIVLYGLFEIIFVYGDDFKAKAMQKAIGTGIPRRRIINTKWVETMILLAFDGLLTWIILVIMGFIGATGFDMHHVGELFLFTLGNWFVTVATIGVISIITFAAQGIGVAVLLYLAISFNLIGTIIKAFGGLLKLEKWHFESYELQNAGEVLIARLELYGIHWQSLLIILIYGSLSFLLATFLFNRKELEF